MHVRQLRPLGLLSMAMAAALFATSAAKAVPLTFVTGGGDVQSFTADLNVVGGSVPITVGANANFTFKTSVPLFGQASVSGSMSIPTQTVHLVLNGGGTINVIRSPTGSALLTLWDEQVGGFDPGLDGGNPNPSATLPSFLTKADLTGLDVQMFGGVPVNITSNSINVNANATIPVDILNLVSFDISLSGTITGSASGAITHFDFNQTPGHDALIGNGTGPNPPFFGTDLTTNYFAAAGGDISGGLSAGMNASMNVDVLGIFDIPFDLGQILDFSTVISENFPLPGFVELKDLNPTGYNPPGDDLQTTIGLNFGGVPIDIPLQDGGTAPLNFSGGTFNFAGLTWTVSVTGTSSFSVNATLQATNVTYQLQDTTLGVVAPEPSALWLLAMGAAGIVPLALRRRRR